MRVAVRRRREAAYPGTVPTVGLRRDERRGGRGREGGCHLRGEGGAPSARAVCLCGWKQRTEDWGHGVLLPAYVATNRHWTTHKVTMGPGLRDGK